MKEWNNCLPRCGLKVIRHQGRTERSFLEKCYFRLIREKSSNRFDRFSFPQGPCFVPRGNKQEIVIATEDKKYHFTAFQYVLEGVNQRRTDFAEGTKGTNLLDDPANSSGLVMGPLQVHGLLFKPIGIIL